MARTTSGGLFVWDLGSDSYNHTQLAANWDLVQTYWTGFDTTSHLPRRLHTVSTVPGSGTLGDIVFLTSTNGGYQANTFLRYDGANWRPIGGVEIQPAVPTSGNFAGRVVILSATDSGFAAWSIIKYNGTTWDLVGGWSAINTGAGSLNILGVQQAFDAYISDSARGFILKDRTSGTNYRLFIDAGILKTEAVT